MFDAKLKYTFPQLALIDWLLEKPSVRFFYTYSGYHSSNDIFLVEINNEDGSTKQVLPVDAKTDLPLIKRLGGKRNFDTHNLYVDKLINHLPSLSTSEYKAKFQARIPNFKMEHDKNVGVPNKNMLIFWEEKGKALYNSLLAKREAERNSVNRRVIIGTTSSITPSISKDITDKVPSGIKLPLPLFKRTRPHFIATVVKQSAARVYLDDIQALRQLSFNDGYTIKGTDPNKYAAIEDILVDNATQHIADKLVFIDGEYQEDINRITNDAMREMLPILQNMNSRLLQKDAELEDMQREILEATNSTKEFK